MSLPEQICRLFLIAMPIACISWTVTHEEVFAEPRNFCVEHSKKGHLLKRKFFYLFTCEYCFSHYVTIAILVITGFQLLYTDWRGYLLAGFSLVWVANFYMSIFARIRVHLKKDSLEAKEIEQELNEKR